MKRCLGNCGKPDCGGSRSYGSTGGPTTRNGPLPIGRIGTDHLRSRKPSWPGGFPRGRRPRDCRQRGQMSLRGESAPRIESASLWVVAIGTIAASGPPSRTVRQEVLDSRGRRLTLRPSRPEGPIFRFSSERETVRSACHSGALPGRPSRLAVGRILSWLPPRTSRVPFTTL